MESETLNISQILSSSSWSSWPIIRGSLDDVVTCESSIYAADEFDSDADRIIRKLPLILRRPSPDSSPCEITINFTQQHEIKQIYIRSTAKVYEIYCATNDKSENEYLCTVRCGIAARDEDLQVETDGVGSSSTCSSRSVDEVHSRTDSGSGTDGDGWVDVKLNTSSTVGDSSLRKKEEGDLLWAIQDRFEATAEISDGDPVMSITLRLLSIQSGDYTYIDEVYVFADPVVATDDHCSDPSLETSFGGGRLSMFMPTLLQLSKSRMSSAEEHSCSAVGERSINQDTEQQSTCAPVTSTNTVRTEVSPSMVHSDMLVHQPSHLFQTPAQNRPEFIHKENDLCCRKIGQTLDEIVSRVSKIEAFCMRFEDNMLKPINNMETKLEKVEQQLELIIKSQFSGTGCRYSAPESCNDTQSDSICVGGKDTPVTLKSESSTNNDRCPQELCIPTSDTYVQSSTTASASIPGLIISVPEFSSIEEEEINFKAVKDCPEIFKKTMSIDDALASALAGFVISTSTKPLERTSTVKGSENISEERSGSTSPSALSTASAKKLDCTELVEEIKNFSVIKGTTHSFFTALLHSDEHQLCTGPNDECNTSCEDAMVVEMDSLDFIGGEENTVDGKSHTLCEGNSKMAHSSSVGSFSEAETKCSIAERTEADNDLGQTFFIDSYDSPSVVDSALLKDLDSSTGKGIPNLSPAVLQEIIELPSPTIVDFSVPVLDVSFSSLENSCSKSSLESLLVGMPDLEHEVICVREDGGL